MDTVYGLLILAGLFLVVWGWHRLRVAAAKKLNTAVFQRKEHELGGRLTSEQLAFTSALPPADVLSVVKKRLDLSETRGKLPRLYLADSDESALEFGHGSMLGDSFRAVLVVQAADNGGSEGLFSVLNWTVVGGIVGELDDLEYVRKALRAAISEADPAARFEAVPT